MQGSIQCNWQKSDYLNLNFHNYPYHQNKSINLNYNEDYNIYKLEIGYFRAEDNFIEKTFSLEQEFLWLHDKSYAIHKIRPGLVLPFHSDLYSKYSLYYNVNDIRKITRVIIFLEDWSPGHIFQFKNFSLPNWKAGDFVSWTGDTPHLAANLGELDRYTLQLTGHT